MSGIDTSYAQYVHQLESQLEEIKMAAGVLQANHDALKEDALLMREFKAHVKGYTWYIGFSSGPMVDRGTQIKLNHLIQRITLEANQGI